MSALQLDSSPRCARPPISARVCPILAVDRRAMPGPMTTTPGAFPESCSPSCYPPRRFCRHKNGSRVAVPSAARILRDAPPSPDRLAVGVGAEFEFPPGGGHRVRLPHQLASADGNAPRQSGREPSMRRCRCEPSVRTCTHAHAAGTYIPDRVTW